MLPMRMLGATGLRVPVLGFGVSGPHGTPVIPEGDTARLIRQALKGGACLFDTAPFYGSAEARLGRALKDALRDDYLLCTKVGTWPGGGKDFSPAALERQFTRSLRTLGVAQVDILLLHGPPEAGPTDETMKTLLRFKAEGRARLIGVCGRGREIAACDQWNVVQAPVWSEWREYSAARGMGFLGIEAMGDGPTRFPRSGADLWRLARQLRRGSRAGPSGSAEEQLEAALKLPGVSSVIVTTSRPAHLDADIAIARQRQA